MRREAATDSGKKEKVEFLNEKEVSDKTSAVNIQTAKQSL